MGLNAEEDRAFLQMFARAKLAAPLAICLVNVSNISLHPHFSMIEAFIRRRGYEIVWQQVHDVVQFRQRIATDGWHVQSGPTLRMK